ncbi:MAG: uroporphyrinogen-III synthase [Candidatus Zixiibacteriota bacterium]|nr:MAG: uroporphyrinogen-III synthase [candidate division Zixibacteria bacterium]
MIETVKKVIITRDRDKAAPLMAALEPYSVLSYAVPVTKTVFDISKTIPEDLNEYNCVAFTSAVAVEALSKILNKSGLNLKRGLKIFAVGSSTAAAAENAFGKPDLAPEKSDAGSLATGIIEKMGDPRTIKAFWPCGVDALPDFREILAEAGADITRWECYRTEALDSERIRSELQALSPWDLVFFAAPSAVKAFSDAWEDRSGFVPVAIGPTTQRALESAGYDNVITSKGTTVIKCAGAIVDALRLKAWS